METFTKYQRYALEHPLESVEGIETEGYSHMEHFENYSLAVVLWVSIDPLLCKGWNAQPMWCCGVSLAVAGRELPAKMWRPYHLRMAHQAASRALLGVGDLSIFAPFMCIRDGLFYMLQPLTAQESILMGIPIAPSTAMYNYFRNTEARN